MVGILDYGLAKVADLMMKHIVTPAVNYESPITIVEELNQGLGEMTDSLLKIVSSAEPKVIVASHNFQFSFSFLIIISILLESVGSLH